MQIVPFCDLCCLLLMSACAACGPVSRPTYDPGAKTSNGGIELAFTTATAGSPERTNSQAAILAQLRGASPVSRGDIEALGKVGSEDAAEQLMDTYLSDRPADSSELRELMYATITVILDRCEQRALHMNAAQRAIYQTSLISRTVRRRWDIVTLFYITMLGEIGDERAAYFLIGVQSAPGYNDTGKGNTILLAALDNIARRVGGSEK